MLNCRRHVRHGALQDLRCWDLYDLVEGSRVRFWFGLIHVYLFAFLRGLDWTQSLRRLW